MFMETMMRPRAIKPGMWIETKSGVTYQVTDVEVDYLWGRKRKYCIWVDGLPGPVWVPATFNSGTLVKVNVLIEL